MKLSIDYITTVQPSVENVAMTRITKHKYLPLLFMAFDQGDIIIYNLQHSSYQSTITLFTSQVIDLKNFRQQYLASCTHDHIQLTNIQKKIITTSFEGHQSSIFHIDVHPYSPIIASVSNCIIMHDIRTRKPIFLNFSFSRDGHYYIVGGDPLRIGAKQWTTTLINGTGRFSKNNKFIINLSNQGKNIDIWDWKFNEIITRFTGLKAIKYQVPFFIESSKKIKGIVLQQDGNMLIYDVMQNELQNRMDLGCPFYMNVVEEINNQSYGLYLYNQQQCVVKIFRII